MTRMTRICTAGLLTCAVIFACTGSARDRAPDCASTAAGCPGGNPDAGPPPSGVVGYDGGTVDRLWFATTGDTRPGSCDASDQYPGATMATIAASMKQLAVQFAIDLGDHMYVCNQSFAEATQQMGYYTAAVAQGPATWFMTMGNHECGHADGTSSCFDASADANFHAYMTALGRPRPYYAVDVNTSFGLARIVSIADDSYDAAQASWLEQTLADADLHAKYTIVARHHPLAGSRAGSADIVSTIERHKYSLLLTAHVHAYAHGTDHGGRAAIVGLGGAPGLMPPGFGTVLQNSDGSLTFTLRDTTGNPLKAAWSVQPQ